MKKVVRWLSSKKVVMVFLSVATVADVLFTLWVLSLFSREVINEFKASEKNILLRYFFDLYGVHYSLLVIFPAIMMLVIMLICRFWESRFWRGYGYFLFVFRVGLTINNIAVLVLLIKGGMVR